MPSFLIYAVTAIITYIAYVQLHGLFETVVRKVPPKAANSWKAFLTGKSLSGGDLLKAAYEKVRRNFVFV